MFRKLTKQEPLFDNFCFPNNIDKYTLEHFNRHKIFGNFKDNFHTVFKYYAEKYNYDENYGNDKIGPHHFLDFSFNCPAFTNDICFRFKGRFIYEVEIVDENVPISFEYPDGDSSKKYFLGHRCTIKEIIPDTEKYVIFFCWYINQEAQRIEEEKEKEWWDSLDSYRC